MNIDSINTGSLAQLTPPREQSPQRVAPSSTEATPQKATESNNAVQNPRSVDATNGQPSVNDAVKRLSEFISQSRPDISFTIDQASGVQVVKVLDSQTKDVIRQFPSEEAIQIAKVLDKLQGLFVKDKA